MFKLLGNIIEATVEVVSIPCKIVDKVVVTPVKEIAKEINEAIED